MKAAIRLRLRATGPDPFNKILLDKLTFFMGGPESTRARLYEQLIANVAAIHVRPTTRPVPWQERLPPTAIGPVGFEPEEALLPRTGQSFDGYRLLQEYYAMPERFLFVALDGLDRAAIRCAGNELEIVLLLTRGEPSLAAGFGPDHLALFCTPAINLFNRRSDRINLSDRDVEHLIVPDRMRPLDLKFSPCSRSRDMPRTAAPRHNFCRSMRPTISAAIRSTAHTTHCGANRACCPRVRASVARAVPISVTKRLFRWLIRTM
ncbi:MAG: type VI secretion system baseplate subunit TssF [Rhodospirillales bacterium]